MDELDDHVASFAVVFWTHNLFKMEKGEEIFIVCVFSKYP